jgi:hypothetical protein
MKKKDAIRFASMRGLPAGSRTQGWICLLSGEVHIGAGDNGVNDGPHEKLSPKRWLALEGVNMLVPPSNAWVVGGAGVARHSLAGKATPVGELGGLPTRIGAFGSENGQETKNSP